ncbi:MAG: hypothetical protein FWF67_08005 [Fibromonadales bacterium]|nr:hypothetical protein [Fibromonadales bacterium]
MTETQTNRNHKDSVFTRLFSEKSNLLELYSAISGKSYPENTKIEIVTLSDVLYMNQINDIAFVLDNINKGRNANMAVKSSVLNGYEEFIAEIKKNLKSMDLREAIKLAVKTCISKNILVSFLERHSSEVLNMLIRGEWNIEEAIAVRYEEGRIPQPILKTTSANNPDSPD